MSAHHNSAMFKNSCLKVPVNPYNKLPSALYEQSKEFIQDSNRTESYRINSEQSSKSGRKTKNTKTEQRDNNQMGSMKTFLEFYDSIPDYCDVYHLSNKEFYERLNNLKLKQKLFMEAKRDFEERDPKWLDVYRIDENERKCGNERVKTNRAACNKSDCKSLYNQIKRRQTEIMLDSYSDLSTPTRSVENQPSFVAKSKSKKHAKSTSPHKRTVRIENFTPSDSLSSIDLVISKEIDALKETTKPYRKKYKQHRTASAKSKSDSNADYSWDVYNDNYNYVQSELLSDSELDAPHTEYLARTRSLPSSPSKIKTSVGWKDQGVTIPKPFKMTVRDEEDKIINELLTKTDTKERKGSEFKMFRANPVPIESRVPLFDKIMEDQERRREIVKLNRKIDLQSQIRPFSFTKREEELRDMTRLFCSKSTPQLTCGKDHSPKTKTFKAKPVPKNLFSNYFYQKMREDEYYRALKKKIRAEEMLKAASLPPSMAERENKPRKTCRHISDQEEIAFLQRSPVKRKPIPNYQLYHDRIERDLEDFKNDFITTSPRPYKFISDKRGENRVNQHQNVCTRSREGSENIRARSALELQSVNRSNLAAVLRIQSAKKRIQVEMEQRLEEERRRDEVRWKTRIARRRPAWRTIKYDHAAELALRLQMRREEERLRSEEHRHRMELMHDRVQRLPMLFERQTQFPVTVKTRDEVLREIYEKLDEDKNNQRDEIKQLLVEDTENYIGEEISEEKVNDEDVRENGFDDDKNSNPNEDRNDS